MKSGRFSLARCARRGARRRSTVAGVLLVTWLGVAVTFAAARQMQVQVREGHLRSAPSYLSAPREQVPYADAVEVLSEKGSWFEVRTSGGTRGWMHASALTRTHIGPLATDEQVRTAGTRDEIALAGRGFNADVESAYGEAHRLDFSWVDRMEGMGIAASELQRFLREGGLGNPGGAGRD